MLTTDDVAAWACVTRSTVHLWLTSGVLPAGRLGWGWRVSPAALAAWAHPVGGEVLQGLEPLCTVEAAAVRLSCTTDHLRRLLAAGRFPGLRLGRLWRVTERSLLAFGAPPINPSGTTGEDPAIRGAVVGARKPRGGRARVGSQSDRLASA